MKRMSFIVSVMLVLVLLTTPVFAKQIKVGMAFQEMDNEYFIVMHEAIKEATASIGAELYVTDARHDVTKQISDVEDMVQRGIDILLLNPADSVGAEAAVQAAKAAGVIVVTVDAQAEGPVDAFVGSRNYNAGYMAGEFMAEELGGKGNVAILDGIPVVPILERVAGFRDAVANYPDIKIVDIQNGHQERSYAMTVVENMLQANPDLDALFSVNDTGSLGALAAIEGSGLDVYLYSVDGHPEAIEAILGGEIFRATSAQFPRDQVRIGFGMALAKLWGAHVPSEIPVDVMLIDKTNASTFSW